MVDRLSFYEPVIRQIRCHGRGEANSAKSVKWVIPLQDKNTSYGVSKHSIFRFRRGSSLQHAHSASDSSHKKCEHLYLNGVNASTKIKRFIAIRSIDQDALTLSNHQAQWTWIYRIFRIYAGTNFLPFESCGSKKDGVISRFFPISKASHTFSFLPFTHQIEFTFHKVFDEVHSRDYS